MIERTELVPGYGISRLLKGGWHLAGGHGSVDARQAVADMAAFVEAGITSFDCADHYTGVEQMIGDFRRDYPSLAPLIQVHTKYVPDLGSLATLTRADVVRIIDRSLLRLGVERLDLVQFFWWDWAVKGAVDAALVLSELQRAGKIRLLGVTNFNTDQLAELIDAGVDFRVNQIQYSLVDRRAEYRMRQYCRARDIAILTYGHLLGGFFSAEWLGKPEPMGPFENRSLTKYKLIIEDFGGWELFQRLLGEMARIGARHGVGIGEVALRWTLDRAGVAGCIVGATSTRHLAANARVFDFVLSQEDRAALALITDERSGPAGDCYQLENDRTGRHGRIMRYNQNALPSGDNRADPAIRELRAQFSVFRAADPRRLHAAAHVDPLWPDATRPAQAEAWTAARAGHGWAAALRDVWPEVAAGIAGHLNLPDAASLTPAASAEALLAPVLSARPQRVLVVEGAFGCWRDGLAGLAVTEVAEAPRETLRARIVAAAAGCELVLLPAVLPGSGAVLPDLAGLVGALAASGRRIAVDATLAFLATPLDLAPIAGMVACVIGSGGPSMAGDGLWVLHAPFPVTVTAEGDATALFRLRAVLRMLAAEGIDAAAARAHAQALQRRFLFACDGGAFDRAGLAVPEEAARAGMLAYDLPDAAAWHRRLSAANIVAVLAGGRLQLGFGLYHGAEDIDRLAERLRGIDPEPPAS